jgi:hypothetical protein
MCGSLRYRDAQTAVPAKCRAENSWNILIDPLIIYRTNKQTAACRRNLVPTFVDRGVSRIQRGGSPTVVNLSFLDWSRYFSFK